MIRIAINVEALEAIARTPPLGNVSYEDKTDEERERLIVVRVVVGVSLGYIVTDAI